MIETILKVMFFLYIWVLGIKIVTAEGMIFENIGKYGKQKIEEGYKVYEALVNCEWCLPSIHSIFGYVFAFALGVIPFEWNWNYIIMWPIVVMGTSLCTGLTWTIYLTINDIKDNNEIQAKYYRHMEQHAFFELRDRKRAHNETSIKKTNSK